MLAARTPGTTWNAAPHPSATPRATTDLTMQGESAPTAETRSGTAARGESDLMTRGEPGMMTHRQSYPISDSAQGLGAKELPVGVIVGGVVGVLVVIVGSKFRNQRP
jgi:hypothetical protein